MGCHTEDRKDAAFAGGRAPKTPRHVLRTEHHVDLMPDRPLDRDRFICAMRRGERPDGATTSWHLFSLFAQIGDTDLRDLGLPARPNSRANQA
jgi:hypothetical protein